MATALRVIAVGLLLEVFGFVLLSFSQHTYNYLILIFIGCYITWIVLLLAERYARLAAYERNLELC
jgi:hypothetical protein